MSTAFEGAARALSSAGLASAANSIGVGAPEIWTVLTVETSGCGFLADRRPQILFERHVFHRLTHGQFDDGAISDPSPGGYGPRGAFQYQRLQLAIAKDRSAALQSASWGIGQVMGFNFRAAGFSDAESMVAAMSDSEDAQLAAMGGFLLANHLAAPLAGHDWKAFALGYNGQNYAINQYDKKLGDAFTKFTTSQLPNLDVRAVQLYLGYLGFTPGSVDGVAGARTLSALNRFQTQNGLPQSAAIDSTVVGQLWARLSGSAVSASSGS
jgi:N-acetylmuramidase/Putative peptidoglycan binding domain